MSNTMYQKPFRVFYYIHDYHRGQDLARMDCVHVNSMDEVKNLDIYYATDINGEVVIDNREKFNQ